MTHKVNNGHLHKRCFGGKWNSDTSNLEVAWYDDDPEQWTYIERPFSSRTTTLSLEEARELRDILNERLEGK